MTESIPRILVFIPAYRCEAQIPRVIDQFDENVQQWVDTVIVIDNRSPDNTLSATIERSKSRFTQCRFIAWLNDKNYGLGGSHKAAFRYAIEQGFDYLIVLHGDDQADIRDVIPELERGAHLDVDCLLGARFMSSSRLKGYSRIRTLGNHVYNKLFSLSVFRNIHDLGSGLNLYRLDTFREFYYKSFPDDLTFNYVMLLASYHAGQRVRFFPISWREEDQLSNVKLFRQAFKVLGMLGVFFFKRGTFLTYEMRTQPFESYSGKIVHSIDRRK
ncbi:glycosyltransferase family 2 protein [Limnohabitans sp. T6-20]|uniref:glycosyltransferase family 2 protein n=1 Tax=Limnohabitans sp. T6-20 TaxID=1100725 RepID=UPI000D3B175F|nr:glycosyltransferase family 2 protein [Limnohabitans sp. T6-20]PUE09765.1 dolichyl-phosphate mannose synthase [Limnohabitans sp. T6-20]